MSSSSAQPLKVAAGSTPSKLSSRMDLGTDATPSPAPSKSQILSNPSDISSPHELTAFVENLLEQLDNKFDDMSSQILDRMMHMSSRVDALEASLQDIINGDVASASSVPPSPSVMSTPGSTSRRTTSGLSS